MKGKLAILFLFLFMASSMNAQHQFDQWCFGYGGGLDFTSGQPKPFKCELSAAEGSSSIADPVTGKLLFYTDGRTVYNSKHQMMLNGSGLSADASSSQAALIVKAPADNKLYYIFTTSPDLRYSVVDMSRQDGLGAVTDKEVLLRTGITEKITAGMHGNGTDIWIIVISTGGTLLSYQITSKGVQTTAVESPNQPGFGLYQAIGEMKINEQDSQLVLSAYNPALDIYSFNKWNGKLTYRYSLDSQRYTYGVGFSPNGRFIYTMRQIMDAGGYEIVQYDLTAGKPSAIIDSKYTVSHSSSCYGLIQIGPDGKIYTPDSGKESVSVINSPDEKGANCDFEQSAIALTGGGRCGLGLPQAFWARGPKILMPLPPPY